MNDNGTSTPEKILSRYFQYQENLKHSHPSVGRKESEQTIRYLENPVSTGLWRLSSQWNKDGGSLSNRIWNEFRKEIDGKDLLTVTSGKRQRRIKVDEKLMDTVREEVFMRLTFLIAIFKNFVEQDDSNENEISSEPWDEHEILQLLLDILDFSEIRRDFTEQIDFFRKNIWFDGMKSAVMANELNRHASGSFILTKGPKDAVSIRAISWEHAPLSALMIFLEQLGNIDTPSLMPIFSPEEEAFEPYFELSNMVKHHLVDQEHLLPVIEKAITHFNESNYTDCVSAIGLASEDVLTQIFETLYREQLTKGLTLGQLADEIQSRAIKTIKKKEDPPPELNQVFKEIKSALDSGTIDAVAALEILRKFAATTIEAHKFLNQKIDRIGKSERTSSLFSSHVAAAVNELIRYRNAASHKSRVPIGPYECRRSAYSFVVLFRWWAMEKTKIVWTASPEEIIKNCLERNCK